MTPGFLSKPDLRRLTGAATRAGQIVWLEREGIPWKPNGKHEVLVTWNHVNAWMEGRERPAGRGINWAAC